MTRTRLVTWRPACVSRLPLCSVSPLRRGAALLGILALGLAVPLAAQPAGACAAVQAQAEAAFTDGDAEGAIALLAPCVEAGAAIPAHRLLALAYLNAGRADAARNAVAALLVAHPRYQPDPVQDPPSYTVLVQLVREQLVAEGRLAPPMPPAAPPWYQRRGPWAVLGAGLVAVGLVALFVAD